MEKLPISVVVITKNEEKRLPECLQSVAWAADIVVVDDGSTDKTIEVAKNFGARVFERKMENEGRHRNFANSQASQNWVISVDADERVSEELRDSLAAMLKNEQASPHVCYAVNLKYFLGDEWIRGASYDPAWRTRVFRKGQFSFKEETVHPPVQYEGSCGRLEGRLIHYSWPHWHGFFDKLNRETRLEAGKWIEQKRKVSALEAVRKSTSRFLKNYFQKGGCRHGFNGFLMSCAHAWYQLMTFAKYRELLKNEKLYERR